MLRAEAGRNSYDRALTDLVGKLCIRSEEFRTRWADHDVRLHSTGVKQFRHPVVGEFDLTFDTVRVTADLACCRWRCSAFRRIRCRRCPASAGQLGGHSGAGPRDARAAVNRDQQPRTGR
jgi:hypothetical protein